MVEIACMPERIRVAAKKEKPALSSRGREKEGYISVGGRWNCFTEEC
jgi:hypothetical protein